MPPHSHTQSVQIIESSRTRQRRRRRPIHGKSSLAPFLLLLIRPCSGHVLWAAKCAHYSCTFRAHTQSEWHATTHRNQRSPYILAFAGRMSEQQAGGGGGFRNLRGTRLDRNNASAFGSPLTLFNTVHTHTHTQVLVRTHFRPALRLRVELLPLTRR